MLGDDWELRMERAALQGALSRTPTLKPFVQELADEAKRQVQEAIDDGNRQLDEIEAAIHGKVRSAGEGEQPPDLGRGNYD